MATKLTQNPHSPSSPGSDDAGSKKLGVHIDDERYNLWPHQGDDDLPDPLLLKRGAPVVRKDYHRGIRMSVWLTPNERTRIARLQKRRQLTFQDWVRRAIDLDEKARPSEAGQYMRRIVPEQVAILGERACSLLGDIKFADANRQTDWETRKALRAEAGAWWNAAAWFSDVRKDYERLDRSPETE